MQYRKIATAIATASLFFTLTTGVFAQDASPSPSPSDTPSPSPSADASPSPSPSTEASAGGTTKEEVLGDTTELGSTGTEKEIAKWLIAGILAALVFAVTIKIARTSAKK